MSEARGFYFGCHEQSGHFLWRPGPESVPRRDYPPGLYPKIDGGFCPAGDQEQGRSKLSLFVDDGGNVWTILNFWDRSIDSRPGSHSAFVVEGERTFAEVRFFAQERFRNVWARILAAGPVLMPESG